MAKLPRSNPPHARRLRAKSEGVKPGGTRGRRPVTVLGDTITTTSARVASQPTDRAAFVYDCPLWLGFAQTEACLANPRRQ